MSTKKIRIAALEERLLRVRGDVFLPSADPMAGPRALERLMRGCFGDRSDTVDPEALPPGGVVLAMDEGHDKHV